MTTNGNRFCSDFGFSMISALIGLFSITLISLAINQTTQVLLSKRENILLTDNSLESTRNQINELLSNSLVIQNTIAGNPSLSCFLQNPIDCSSTNFEAIDIFDLDGTKLYHQLGFDKYGKACNGHSDLGNDNCPFKYNFFAKLVCPDFISSCTDPFIVIEGTLIYKPSNTQSLNTNLFKISSVNTRTVPSAGITGLQCFSVKFSAPSYTLSINPLLTNPPADASYVIPYKMGENPFGNAFWGWKCANGWIGMGCALSANGTGDLDVGTWLNGCKTDDDEFAQNAILSGTCCKVN